VCFHRLVTAIPRRRNLGVTLLALVPVFLLLTLGLAFTIFGEVAALFAVVCLVTGVTVLFRGRRRR
jgi:hypothetical protein